MKLFYILIVIFCCIFSEKIQAQVKKNDSTACIFWVRPGDAKFQMISNYFYWLMDIKTYTDSVKNPITQYRGKSVTIIAKKMNAKFDPIIESIIERKGRNLDSVTIRKSGKMEQEDWVGGGYTDHNSGITYNQGDIKYRDAGDSTLIIRKYYHQYHPPTESGRRR